MANYFSIYKGTEDGHAKINIPPWGVCHPRTEAAIAAVKEAWVEVRLRRFQAILWRCMGADGYHSNRVHRADTSSRYQSSRCSQQVYIVFLGQCC